MDENRFSPTFANILSSLKVKGATATGGNGKDGFVPVLGSDGTLDLSVIPVDLLQQMIDVPALERTAFVDSNAVVSELVSPTGSIAKPFKTLTAAAAVRDGSGYSKFRNFILMGGNYGSEYVFMYTPQDMQTPIRVCSLGSSTFTSLTLDGYSNGTIFEFSNVSVSGALVTASNVESCSLTLSGAGVAGSVTATDSDIENITVLVSDDFSVVATTGPITIGHLSSSDRIANDSTVDGGAGTVSDALDSLGIRKIRIPEFTSDENGLHADSYADVPASSGLYNLLGLNALVNAINSVFHKDGDSVNYANVTATGAVSSPSVSSNDVTTDSVTFRWSGTVVHVSQDNFLELTEE